MPLRTLELWSVEEESADALVNPVMLREWTFFYWHHHPGHLFSTSFSSRRRPRAFAYLVSVAIDGE